MDADITEIEDAVRRLPKAERVRLIEVIARSLRDPELERAPELTTPNRTAVERLLDEMDNLPSRSPADGFSNREHDRVLYGDHR
ncbi:hypothetical protein [Thiohalocapsa sp. ML1]|jgi:hypothetical protein|uniref:hypothetical protein n=1 Tax=Thiohalocapsa sp. ML1 TaxID=1431688 RepID=UPI0007320B82|nr:hypothetical protein [Thiohalocapsa sp. ML1]